MTEPEVRYLRDKHSYLQISVLPGDPYPVCFVAADDSERSTVLIRCENIEDVRLALLDMLDLLDEAVQFGSKDKAGAMTERNDGGPARAGDLTDHEIELLRDMNGEETSITGWGSWMSTAVGALASRGLCTRLPSASITAEGKAWLNSYHTARTMLKERKDD